ncbi:major facilitator transporter [Alkalihalobacillus alcalophilus ATCC 27647 = CGMCC 1.3604]|nr:tetracycline resistance MFS efflux pump [Alkalihalobacillus alcalophilus]KGA98186.1 major facilitator transporter [Alkalihalobacillus alcalophilus ATCC 27647 = CGMCC 1.3604]MED1560818.1 tetracycline resistance MFS efflux pump [Alkalihalobacillus alcalophilus]THG91206.1 major facilitator transporter [Alkalihalobacillus alcalophilus ATCC 27647 = CGMCC 1.3604]
METKKVLPILFAIMFLVMVGFGIIIPVMPFYAEDLGASPTQLGLLMAVYSLMQFIFAPMWGRISDRIGRKPVLLIGIAGLSLSFFLMAFASTLWMLFAARIIGGFLSAANMPTVMAYVADITSEENRSKGMGIIGAAVGLGFVFGPGIGGIFSDTSLTIPFYLAGASSLITFFLVLIVLKESLSEENKGATNRKRLSLKSAFNGPASNLFLLQLFVTLSLAGLEATFAYYAYEKAGLGPVQLGYIFMIMGFAGAIVQGGLVGRLTKKIGEGKVIQLGIFISALGFALILFIDSFVTAAIFLSIFGIGNGFIRPSVSSLVTKRAKSAYGQVTGLLSSMDSLGRIIGPPLGGLLFSIAINLPFIIGMILSFIAYFIYRLYAHQVNKEEKLSPSGESV